MHGFIKLHRQNKDHIMDHLVGQVDLQPPRRSTLHCAAPPSAAVITTAQAEAEADVDALGWAECPIGCVAAFAAPAGDSLETVEPTPQPADFVVAGRRARSKRRRSSAYQRGGSSKNVKEEKVQEEEGKWLAPSSPPPLWMRSPTPPPPPPSPQRPHAVAPPPPVPQCWAQPTLAPLRHPPPSFGSPTVPPPRPQLSWGLPLPTVPPSSCPGAPMFTQHPWTATALELTCGAAVLSGTVLGRAKCAAAIATATACALGLATSRPTAVLGLHQVTDSSGAATATTHAAAPTTTSYAAASAASAAATATGGVLGQAGVLGSAPSKSLLHMWLAILLSLRVKTHRQGTRDKMITYCL